MRPATPNPPRRSWMPCATNRPAEGVPGGSCDVVAVGRSGRRGGQAADLVALVALAAGVWALPAPTSGETVSTTALTSSCWAEISETTKSYCESITSTGFGNTSGYVTLGTRPSAYSTPLLT